MHGYIVLKELHITLDEFIIEEFKDKHSEAVTAVWGAGFDGDEPTFRRCLDLLTKFGHMTAAQDLIEERASYSRCPNKYISGTNDADFIWNCCEYDKISEKMFARYWDDVADAREHRDEYR